MTRNVFGRVSAEIMVIVTGVLLALWAEAWREARSQRLLGASYVQRLLADVEGDSLRFVRIRFMHREYREAAQGLLNVIEGGRDATPGEVAHLLARAGYLAPDNSVTSTYDDVVSSGRLFLIEDLELRARVQGYYSDLARRMQVFNAAPTGLQDISRRWLPGRFAREAQQCLWPEFARQTGDTVLDVEECHPEITAQQAVDVVSRLGDNQAEVTGFLNEVIWYSVDVEYKFAVQERRRASLKAALDLATGR